MRKITTLGMWGVAALLLLPLQLFSQEPFFGAQWTGEHTVGLSFRYDGNFAVGAVYNYQDFGDGENRPIQYNGHVEYRLGKQNISALHVEFGVNQMIADGWDDRFVDSDYFDDSFAMGCRLSLAWDKAFDGPNMGDGCNSRLSLKGGFIPGYQTQESFVGANIKADLVSAYFGGANSGYRREARSGRTTDWRFVEATTLGLHFDWVNDEGQGDFHIAADVDWATYLNVQSYKAWRTWDDNMSDNKGTPNMQRSNLGADLYLNYRW